MTLQNCYAAMGGDYDEVMGRLRSERLIQKFVLKFLEDGSCDLLYRSMECGDWEEAFRAAHTIKGMCQNLSFTALAKSSGELTEMLRGGKKPGADRFFEQVKDDYCMTVDAIRAFKRSL